MAWTTPYSAGRCRATSWSRTRPRSWHDVPDALELDPSFRLSPVDYGDVCLNYDKAWFKDHNLAPPDDLLALTEPEYRALTVVENPATSSPGLRPSSWPPSGAMARAGVTYRT